MYSNKYDLTNAKTTYQQEKLQAQKLEEEKKAYAPYTTGNPLTGYVPENTKVENIVKPIAPVQTPVETPKETPITPVQTTTKLNPNTGLLEKVPVQTTTKFNANTGLLEKVPNLATPTVTPTVTPKPIVPAASGTTKMKKWDDELDIPNADVDMALRSGYKRV